MSQQFFNAFFFLRSEKKRKNMVWVALKVDVTMQYVLHDFIISFVVNSKSLFRRLSWKINLQMLELYFSDKPIYLCFKKPHNQLSLCELLDWIKKFKVILLCMQMLFDGLFSFLFKVTLFQTINTIWDAGI